MKLQKPYQTKVICSAAALALLLAMGTANAGGNNKRGASIGVSNTCELASDNDTGKPVLRVTTTIINKSSGDVSPDFTEDGTRVRAKEKGSGKGEKYMQVGEPSEFTGELGETVTNIQLCAADDTYLGPDNTVSLNASISVNVDNDNKGEYASRCSDDPATEDVNEGKVVVSSDELDALCMLP
jgi:hypothetical protein